MGAVIEMAHTKYRVNKLYGIDIMYNSDASKISKVKESKKRKRSTQYMNIYEILFVDDWLMMALSMNDLTKMMEIVLEILTMYGLTINWKKTQMMIVTKKITSMNIQEEKLIVQNISIEQVTNFKYLGVTENEMSNMEIEVEKRILAMRIAFQRYT